MISPITYTFEELVAHKENGLAPEDVLEKLRVDADEILTKPTLKVTDIQLPRPSGNIHDYVSVSPYRWPNPDTPDGLPWVRRDGYVNKETRTGIHPGVVYGRIHTLALAAFYFGDNGYSEYANRQMYDWFINPDTYIEPHGMYAQAIPGVSDGAVAGLIEFCTCTNLHNGVGVLDCMGLLDEKILAGVQAWFVKFTDWLLTSERGVAEGNGYDNHGAWYDAQVLSAAVFCQRPSVVKSICQKSYNRRIKTLIKPDGSQPAELKRATPMHYSIYALSAMMIFANIADRLGYSEYWGIDGERGYCILKSAVDFIYPLIKNPEASPYPDIKPGLAGPGCARILTALAKRYPNEGYEERAMEFSASTAEKMWRLEPTI